MADTTSKPAEKGARGRGRPRGALNKATAEVKEIAQAYTGQAIQVLAQIMNNKKESGRVRVAAANALLDRAHGRPHQAIDHTTNGNDLPAGTGVLLVPGVMSEQDWEEAARGLS